MTSQLVIDSISTIETKTYNPFDFLIYPLDFNKLPLSMMKKQKITFASLEENSYQRNY
jgi:hypothetical protein